MAHVIYNENMELILEGENLDLILGPNWAKILDIVCGQKARLHFNSSQYKIW